MKPDKEVEILLDFENERITIDKAVEEIVKLQREAEGEQARDILQEMEDIEDKSRTITFAEWFELKKFIKGLEYESTNKKKNEGRTERKA